MDTLFITLKIFITNFLEGKGSSGSSASSPFPPGPLSLSPAHILFFPGSIPGPGLFCSRFLRYVCRSVITCLSSRHCAGAVSRNPGSYGLGNAFKYAGIVFFLLVIIKTFLRETPTPQGPSTLSKTREICLPGSHG